MYFLKILVNIYVYIFSKKIFYHFNRLILHITLRSIGYKNFGSFFLTGELYVIEKIRNFKIKLSLDIGAHHGNYTNLLLKKTNSKVIAIDPFFKNCKEIKKKNKKFKDRLFVKQIAISSNRGVKKIYYFNKESQLSSLSDGIKKFTYNKNKKLNYDRIKTDTLDNVIKKNFWKYFDKIDFIKIDTEGYEFETLLGAKNIIKKSKPKFIQFEMNWHNLFLNRNLINFSKLLNNYYLYIILPFNSGLRKVDVNSPNNNIFHLSNFLCIRKDISKYFN